MTSFAKFGGEVKKIYRIYGKDIVTKWLLHSRYY
jgi:hypothetical protein